MKKIILSSVLAVTIGLQANILNEAQSAYNNHDYKKAIELHEKSISNGNIESNIQLGYMYFYGEGVKQDKQKGFDYLLTAAKGDIVDAQVFIGNAYENGYQVKKDFKKAAEWYKKAANKSKIASFQLGLIYENGKGTRRDLQKALTYYTKAAELKNNMAMYKLGTFFEKGLIVKKDKKEALRLYVSATLLSKNEEEKFFLYKTIYKTARSVKNFNVLKEYAFKIGQEHERRKDIKSAIVAYKQAEKLYDLKSTNRLAYLYSEGKGVEKDPLKAIYTISSIYEVSKIENQYLMAHSKSKATIDKNISYFYNKNKKEVDTNYKKSAEGLFAYGVLHDTCKIGYTIQKLKDIGEVKNCNFDQAKILFKQAEDKAKLDKNKKLETFAKYKQVEIKEKLDNLNKTVKKSYIEDYKKTKNAFGYMQAGMKLFKEGKKDEAKQELINAYKAGLIYLSNNYFKKNF